MVEENVATASDETALTETERGQIEAMLSENRKLADLYCTGCEYCMPCPNEVNIPEVFRLMNLHRVWGLTDPARKRYGRLASDDSDRSRRLRLRRVRAVRAEVPAEDPDHRAA